MTAAATRHQEIVRLVKQQGFAMIEDLSDRLAVTPQTIRRDISALCEQGVLSRFHGGAGFPSSVTNLPYEARRGSLAVEKSMIGEAVAREIRDDSSVFIDIGTSAEAVADKLLGKRGLRVVTNNLNVVRTLAGKDFDIVVVGGTVRLRDMAVTGEASAQFIEQFKLDYSILGVTALAEDGSLLDFTLDEKRVTQAIIGCARQVFVVADNTKFGRPAFARVGHLSQVSALFTDLPLERQFSELVQQIGLRVVLARTEAPPP